MNVRFGKCESCGAEYKVPASFQHDKARCKECGGVTHFGPAQSPDAPPRFPDAVKAAGAAVAAKPAPMPARKVAPKAAPAPQAPAPKGTADGGGGSMLERLKAQRRAEAEASAQASPKPAAKAARPAAKTATGKPATGKPAPRNAGARAGAKTGAADAGAAKDRKRPAAGARRGATRRKGRGDDEDGEESGGRQRRGSRAKQEKSMTPVLIGIGGIVLVGAGAFFGKDMLFGSDDGAPGTGPEVAAAETTNDAGLDPAAADDALDTTDVEDGAEAATSDDAGTDEPFAGVDPADDASKPDPNRKRKTIAQQDPADTDLTVYDFGPAFDTTDEEWEQMNEWMTSWMDPDAGAAGNRNRDKLLAMDVKAMPVILNAMCELPLGTEAGRRNGDLAQREVTALLSGRNFGWAYPDPAAEDAALEENRVHVYNKKVVEKYCIQWQSVMDQGIEYFITMAKLDEPGNDARNKRAKELRDKYGDAVVPATDGLDVDVLSDDDLEVD